MRNISIILLVLFLTFFISNFALATDDYFDKLIKEQIDKYKIYQLHEYLKKINADNEEEIEFDFYKALNTLIKGKGIIKLDKVILKIFKTLFRYLIKNIRLLFEFLIIAVVFGLLNNLHDSLNNKSVSEISFFATYLILITISITNINNVINIARYAIDDLVNFIQLLLPTLISLLIGVGGIATSALFKPFTFGTLVFLISLMRDFILPLILIVSIIGIVSRISDRIKITKLFELTYKGIIFFQILSLFLFSIVTKIHTATSAKFDGVVIRTTKYAVDKFVPVIGGYLTSAVDTVMNCSLLIKNAVGVLGLVIIGIICFIPLIKIFTLILIYKITIAITQPFVDKRFIGCLEQISNSMKLAFATVVTVALLFFVLITIIVGASTMTISMK